MNKKGFVSTSLIYTFFILFLLLMLFLLNSYSRMRFVQSQYKDEIKASLYKISSADINLIFRLWNPTTKDYELVSEIPTVGYEFESYNCDHLDTTIEYVDGYIEASTPHRDTCYIRFIGTTDDVILRIYIRETPFSERVEVTEVPGRDYTLTKNECTNNANVTFNESTRKFLIKSFKRAICEVEFTNNGGT